MKKTVACLGIILAAILLPATSRAQFLKNLVNNATNKIAGNAANKATGKPAPATGKPDSSVRPGPGYDSASFARMMARANKPKPSISPADSAAAIKSFMTATGGSGLFYQYRVVYTFSIRNKDSTSKDSMSLAITDGHNVRTDMPGAKMRVIGHAGLPRYSVSLFPDSRTYTFNIIDTAAINSRDGATYQVTKIGNETVLGYKCIHSKMTMVTAGQKTGITEDIWTSTGVPGYGTLEKMMTIQNATPAMMRALEQAGCGGFFVKMQMLSKTLSMDMELIRADRRSFPASMFEIPQGYTMGGGTGYGMMQRQRK